MGSGLYAELVDAGLVVAHEEVALLTLEIARRALRRGLSLKDASAFNVQFRGCRPVFIDTLSFEAAREGEPWVAYRQFCEHFLGPLALVARCDARLLGLWRAHLDGVPLDLANPSQGLGWEGRERDTLEARGPAYAVLALALESAFAGHFRLEAKEPLPGSGRVLYLWLADA